MRVQKIDMAAYKIHLYETTYMFTYVLYYYIRQW